MKTRPKILKIPFYGFDHNAVDEEFDGDLTFINEFCVKGYYYPCAVYYVAHPNTDLGHKKYMLLFQQDNPYDSLSKPKMCVSGMTPEEIEKYRYQQSLWCKNCNTVIYSVYRHNMQECRCNRKKFCAIDGGKDYAKVSYGKECNFEWVTLDLLTDTIQIPQTATFIQCIPFTPKKYRIDNDA